MISVFKVFLEHYKHSKMLQLIDDASLNIRPSFPSLVYFERKSTSTKDQRQKSNDHANARNVLSSNWDRDRNLPLGRLTLALK